ncbi:MAG: hypothetical protein EBS42_13580, partial [Caulobacteraceae bacterium]|nr:hypothetical protein [Caulobacteraceae bacterium]
MPLRAVNAPNALIYWSRTSGGVQVRGSGDIVDVLPTPVLAVEEVSYQVKLSSDGCAGDGATVKVRVRPQPVLRVAQQTDTCSATVDLTAASLTAGSSAGLVFGYWKDRGLSQAVEDPKRVFPGLYFLSAKDALGCTAVEAVQVRSAVRLKVNNPAPLCVGGRADLTAASVTEGSESGLSLSYWEDAAATRRVADPRSVPAGRYFIKAEASLAGTACQALQAVEVSEVRPSLENKNEVLEVCKGDELVFVPRTNLVDAEFNWSREAQAGIGNGPASGMGTIRETLLPLTDPVARVRYSYRLRATGCGLLGAELGTLEVAIRQKPELSVQDSTQICSPVTNLRTLVSNPSGYLLGFSYDSLGRDVVPNPSKVLHGRYYVTAKNASSGCASTFPLTVPSRTGAPFTLDTLLEYCPPSLGDLVGFTSGLGLGKRYILRYFLDVDTTRRVADASKVGEGRYYLLIQDTVRENAACRAILPIEVRQGTARMDSPLAVAFGASGPQTTVNDPCALP